LERPVQKIPAARNARGYVERPFSERLPPAKTARGPAKRFLGLLFCPDAGKLDANAKGGTVHEH